MAVFALQPLKNFNVSHSEVLTGEDFHDDDLNYSHMKQTAKNKWEFLLYCLGRHLDEKFR